MIFDTWKRKIDGLCYRLFMISSDDLPDAPWREYYDDGMSPVDSVDCAVIDYWSDVPAIEALWYGEEEMV